MLLIVTVIQTILFLEVKFLDKISDWFYMILYVVLKMNYLFLCYYSSGLIGSYNEIKIILFPTRIEIQVFVCIHVSSLVRFVTGFGGVFFSSLLMGGRTTAFGTEVKERRDEKI